MTDRSERSRTALTIAALVLLVVGIGLLANRVLLPGLVVLGLAFVLFALAGNKRRRRGRSGSGDTSDDGGWDGDDRDSDDRGSDGGFDGGGGDGGGGGD